MSDTYTLTAQDVRALRHADDLCFDHLADGTGRIRAILRANKSGTGFEQTHTVPAVQSSVQGYSGPSADEYTAFHMVNSAQYVETATTLMRHMKLGTSFSLVWVRGNSSPVLDNAGMVRDELRIKITCGKHTDTFLVAVMVGLDNTARMIRVAR